MKYVSVKLRPYNTPLFLTPDGTFHEFWDRAKLFDTAEEAKAITGQCNDVPDTALEKIKAGLDYGMGCKEQVVMEAKIDGDKVIAVLQDGSTVAITVTVISKGEPYLRR